MNNEEYRKDDTRFQWRCSWEERKQLKTYAALEGIQMNLLLSEAWKYYVENVMKKKHKVKL